ncbi:MAG: HD domain-containing protein [Candidatus Dojkabacteria bacterium]|jgi:HD superfamily phosphodiesterase
MKLSEKQSKIYQEVKLIFPNDRNNPKLQYVNRDWIFPNHIDIVIDSASEFIKTYYPDANREVVFLASLLHDTGLVYKRTKDDPIGHEERSVEYTKNILGRYGYPEELIKEVVLAVSATEPENKFETVEAKIVRTADAYSHFVSIHFFAKANFADRCEDFFKWFSKKIDTTYEKIVIEEVGDELEPIYRHYRRAIDRYINSSI